MCRVREFNLSYESLTDLRTTRAKLNSLKSTDPEFYAELTGTKFEDTNVPVATEKTLPEDEEPDLDAELEDDSDLASDVVRAVVAGCKPRIPVKFDADGAIAANVVAESNDEPEEQKESESVELEVNIAASSSSAAAGDDGKRKRKENSRYSEAGLRWWKEI